MSSLKNDPFLAMVAGEASGDLLAGLLLEGLKKRWPGLHAAGIGGPRMAEQGFEAWWPHHKLAVRGYVEVLRHYREIIGIRSQLAEKLLREKPGAFIGVDAPDFNLQLETRLKAQGIKTIHFISPSIWAWRGERIETVRRAVDHVLCVFPFEPALYEKAGIPASYVGHPLADAIPQEVPREQSRARLGLSPADQVVAILPGSRRSEIQYIAPRMLQAASLMKAQRPALKFILPVSTGLRSMIGPLLPRHAGLAGVQLLEGQSHVALAACDVTLVASGTATLEAALFKRPMVIAYAMNWLSWQIMRKKRYQPWVGLPNILLNEFVVPEFLQDQASPLSLAEATLAWLDDLPRAKALQQRFDSLHHLLRRQTAVAATHAIEKILNHGTT
ncbi:MAG: lipid-A-disaccharide synthase [Burkholderiales bacterium]|jgi:lipid-A-disaccharide synthase